MKKKLHLISVLTGVIIAVIALVVYLTPDASVGTFSNSKQVEETEKEQSNLLSTSSKIVKTLLSIRP